MRILTNADPARGRQWMMQLQVATGWTAAPHPEVVLAELELAAATAGIELAEIWLKPANQLEGFVGDIIAAAGGGRAEEPLVAPASFVARMLSINRSGSSVGGGSGSRGEGGGGGGGNAGGARDGARAQQAQPRRQQLPPRPRGSADQLRGGGVASAGQGGGGGGGGAMMEMQPLGARGRGASHGDLLLLAALAEGDEDGSAEGLVASPRHGGRRASIGRSSGSGQSTPDAAAAAVEPLPTHPLCSARPGPVAEAAEGAEPLRRSSAEADEVDGGGGGGAASSVSAAAADDDDDDARGGPHRASPGPSSGASRAQPADRDGDDLAAADEEEESEDDDVAAPAPTAAARRRAGLPPMPHHQQQRRGPGSAAPRFAAGMRTSSSAGSLPMLLAAAAGGRLSTEHEAALIAQLRRSEDAAAVAAAAAAAAASGGSSGGPGGRRLPRMSAWLDDRGGSVEAVKAFLDELRKRKCAAALRCAAGCLSAAAHTDTDVHIRPATAAADASPMLPRFSSSHTCTTPQQGSRGLPRVRLGLRPRAAHLPGGPVGRPGARGRGGARVRRRAGHGGGVQGVRDDGQVR